GVDGLLAIADHEDGREKRVGRGAEAFAPSSDELGHQLPLCAARVLKFVDEHVAVAALQPKTTQRELVEVLQQADGSFEHAAEFLSAGTTVLRHEIAAQAVHEPAEPRLAVARLTTWCAHVARKIPHIVGEHGELGAPDGSLVKESVQTTANAAKSVPEVLGR